MRTETVTVTLPKPTRMQKAIYQSIAKRKVVCTGRRAGKTTLASYTASRKSTESGLRVLYAAPTEQQTDAFWNRTVDYLYPLIQYGLIKKLEKTRVLENTFNPGRIKAKTAWDANTMRGDYADILIMDEFAYMDPSAWEEVGQPMLLDNNGDAMFYSTPNMRNHFYHLYLKCAGNPLWEAFHFTSHDNQHLSVDALKELEKDMDERSFRQEIMAEFLEGQGAVFRNFDKCMWKPENLEEHKKHLLVMTIDWGKMVDYTVISLGCADCGKELALDRFNHIEYALQRDRIKALYEAWKPSTVIAERNSIGDPNIEQLNNDGVPVDGFDMTHQSKGACIRQLALALEQETWKFVDDPIGYNEFAAFEMKETKSGNLTFNAPYNMHDDIVIARAMLVYHAQRAHIPVLFGD